MLGLIVLTRVVCRSHMLYDLDSVNFALALGRFDPQPTNHTRQDTFFTCV